MCLSENDNENKKMSFCKEKSSEDKIPNSEYIIERTVVWQGWLTVIGYWLTAHYYVGGVAYL